MQMSWFLYLTSLDFLAIFDRSGRYVITGSDDRLVKVWSMETALCLASCRGHEVSSNLVDLKCVICWARFFSCFSINFLFTFLSL